MKIGRSTKRLVFDPELELFSINKSKILCDENNLSCNVICLCDDSTVVFIISVDLLWLGNKLNDTILKIISDEYSIPITNILLSSTHTHSCPYIDPVLYKNNMTKLDNTIISTVLSAVKSANKSITEGFLDIHYTPILNNINRRKSIVDHALLKSFKYIKKIRNRPNSQGHVDNMCLTLVLYEYPKKPIAVILNYAAHPVLSSQERCSADYPGEIYKILKEYYNDNNFVTCFLQGFSGNIKPNLWEYSASLNNRISVNLFNFFFDRKYFKKNINNALINDYAREIVTGVLCSEIKERIENIFISSSIINVNLELDGNSLSKPVLHLHRLQLSEKLNFIALNGEVFSEYSTWMRKRINDDSYLVTISCSGGMIGYIPTATAINEGGYEIDRCLPIFNQKYRFLADIENTIKISFKKLFNLS